MIEKLRKRFITLSMSAVSAVVLTIILGINILNYSRVNERADILLDMLWENNGFFPNIIGNLSPETKYRTRYFSVKTDKKGEYMTIDTVNIAAKSRQEAAEYAISALESRWSSGFIDGYKYKKGEKQGKIFVVFLDCSQELEIFYSFLKVSFMITILGLIVIFSIIVFYSRRLIAPVAESYEKQKRFITDVSHELKTPLAVINTNTDVIEMIQGKSEWTESIHNQVKRLSGMVTGLITLSRMSENSKEGREEFSLSDAVREVCGSYKHMEDSGNGRILADIEDDIDYFGNEDSIKQLISIGLDNAFKYASGNKSIHVLLRKKDRKNVIEISNPAENIEKGNMDYVFERFYRMDKSRSSNIEGYGIGLSIAESIVRGHNGKISAYSDDGRIFTLKIIL